MKKAEIDKNSHYFALMRPYTTIIPDLGIGLCDGSNPNWVECKIVEDRYKVDDGYKVTLASLNPNFASQDFYQESFFAFLENGHIVKKTNEKMHIAYDVWLEPLTENVFIRHSGYFIEN